MNGKLKLVALLAAMASSLGATWADLPLEFHVKRADAIAKVLIVSRTSFFKTPNEIVTQWEALTDCGAGVLKDRHKPGDPSLKQCSTIVIETEGGRVDSHLAIVTSAPTFSEGQNYWLYLNRLENETFEVVDGAINAFEVSNGSIKSIHKTINNIKEADFKALVAKIVDKEGK